MRQPVLGSTAFAVVASAAALLVVAAALLATFLYTHMSQALTERVLEGLDAEARALVAVAETGGLDGLAKALEGRTTTAPNSLSFLASSDGRRLAGNLSRLPPELEPERAGGLFAYSRAPGAPDRIAAGLSVGLPGDARLIVARDIEDLRAFANRTRFVAVAVCGLVGLAGLAAAVVLSRRLLGRVDAMVAASRAIMAGNLSGRLPRSRSGDELDHLAASLNDMLARIEQLMGGLQEISDNVAHDLKTPLNRLRNRAEAALREAHDPSSLRDGLEEVIERADEIIKTFNALLLIARLEAGAVEETKETFDPADVLGDVTELYEPVAEEAGLSLTTRIENGLAVSANRQLLGQALANLIDNAIKYSRGRSKGARLGANDAVVTVSLHAAGDHVRICVADNGPGIAPEDRQRALRRFVRLDKSRTAPGTGLGLSLVAAVAQLHGGVIRLEDNAPGLRVVLDLPRAA